MEQRLISLDKLKEYPIRLDHYDKEHGSKQFVYGVESVLEYADYLPIVEAIPIDWIKRYIDSTLDEGNSQMLGFKVTIIKEMVEDWEKENDYNKRECI